MLSSDNGAGNSLNFMEFLWVLAVAWLKWLTLAKQLKMGLLPWYRTTVLAFSLTYMQANFFFHIFLKLKYSWWDGWMVSPTWWTWVWMNSRSWWWSGRPGVLQFMGSQRVGHDWATELNWTDLQCFSYTAKWFSYIYIERERGEGNGTPLQYSCLENPMDGGAW